MSTRHAAAVVSARHYSTPAWLTLRSTVTPGSTGLPPPTTKTRSASTIATAVGAVPGSPTARPSRTAEREYCASGALSLPPRRRLAAVLGRSPRLLDASPQHRHQVLHTGAGRDLDVQWPGRGRPALDQGVQPLAIVIRIALRLERPGQGVDQERRHLAFVLPQVGRLGRCQLGGGQDFVGVEHRGQHYQPALRT